MINLQPGLLTLRELRAIWQTHATVELPPRALESVERGAKTISEIALKGDPAYGVNTGFGRLATTHIPSDQLELLQRNLVLSHAVGVGTPMDLPTVRLMMVLKVASLARGNSGVRPGLITALLRLYNAEVLPMVPSKGSVGASGDLAPLAHMAAMLLGVGDAYVQGERTTALAGLQHVGMTPMTLGPKEGLALLNGTQASTALALQGLFSIEDLFLTAVAAGSLSVDAAAGSVVPFDPRIHELRGHRGQCDVAGAYLDLLRGSEINFSHQNCAKVQDPYSLRCQPQVMGACLDQIRYVGRTLLVESNGVTDNPLVFPESGEVLSGGNFHAEYVAFAADALAVAVAEIGALSERRIALLVDSNLSELPPFLVKDGGVNSGFMIAHVTAAALASENKTLAHPASVDSLPTSANQEDHVSMSTFAARKLTEMAQNVAGILGIEILAACQGIELREPLRTSPPLAAIVSLVREHVPHYDIDHYLAPDIATIISLVQSRAFVDRVTVSFDSLVPR